jgi:hypothetical protein
MANNNKLAEVGWQADCIEVEIIFGKKYPMKISFCVI